MRASLLLAMLIVVSAQLGVPDVVRAEEYAEGGYTTSASVDPQVLARGSSVHVTALVASAQPTRATLIDIEVYNPAGTRVFQQWVDGEVIGQGERVAYSVDWASPPGAQLGQYIVRVGIFTPGWDSLLHWNPDAARFTVIPYAGSPTLPPAPPPAAVPPAPTQPPAPPTAATTTSRATPPATSTPTAPAAVTTPIATPRPPTSTPTAATASPTRTPSSTPTAVPTVTPSPTPTATATATRTATAARVGGNATPATTAAGGVLGPPRQPSASPLAEGGQRPAGQQQPPVFLSGPVLGGAILALTLLIVGVVVFDAYRGFARGRGRVEEAWAQLEAQLKRRQDLIPYLVNEVRDYMSFEQGALSRVIEARARAITAGAMGNVAQQAEAEGRLTGALRSLFAVVESYPMLIAREHVLELREQLTAAEDQIGRAQEHYNASVADYNNSVGGFPKLLFAGLLGFRRRQSFNAPATEDEVLVGSAQ